MESTPPELQKGKENLEDKMRKMILSNKQPQAAPAPATTSPTAATPNPQPHHLPHKQYHHHQQQHPHNRSTTLHKAPLPPPPGPHSNQRTLPPPAFQPVPHSPGFNPPPRQVYGGGHPHPPTNGFYDGRPNQQPTDRGYKNNRGNFHPQHAPPSPWNQQNGRSGQNLGSHGRYLTPQAPLVFRQPPPVADSLNHFPPLGTKLSPPPAPAPVPVKAPPLQRFENIPPVILGSEHLCRLPLNQQPLQRQPQKKPVRQLWTPSAPSPHAFSTMKQDQVRILDEFAQTILAEAVPLEGEMEEKEEFLKELEECCREIMPTAKLYPFGSYVSGFATRGSDIDCAFTSGTWSGIDGQGEEWKAPKGFPEELKRKLMEAGYEATLLKKTRVPIIKLVKKPTEKVPHKIECDVGFSNFLAVHNTNLLKRYAEWDGRVVGMVRFIKWWAKRRHVNSPYRGTLSSYGYALLVIHYLLNIVSPPVLTNLQLFPPLSSSLPTYKSYNIWFSPSPPRPSSNTSSLGTLLLGFFEYYHSRFSWAQEVISLRTQGGLLNKAQKGWRRMKTHEASDEEGNTWEVKDRYLLAIEDPFEVEHNVARTVTAQGVMRIRGEFKRVVNFVRIRDGGERLRREMCQEAPEEKPFVRNDEDKVGGKERERGGRREGEHEEREHDHEEEVPTPSTPDAPPIALDKDIVTVEDQIADEAATPSMPSAAEETPPEEPITPNTPSAVEKPLKPTRKKASEASTDTNQLATLAAAETKD